MHTDSILFSIFLIFSGAAVIATAALYARQALLVAYIALGLLFGPSGLELVSDAQLISDIAQVGIIFLLFLLGLSLEPRDLLRVFGEAISVTLISSLLFGIAGFAVGWAFGFSNVDSLVMAVAMMFSSTIIGLKLLPTTALHHQRMGEIIVSILLLQDIMAVTILLLMQGLANEGNPWLEIGKLVLALPLIFALSWATAHYLLTRLLMKFDRIQEYIFLVAIGWCLGIAQLAEAAGLSFEIGAFIAGVSLATLPIARFVAESLKPLRDFFLVMFFFALGAGFDISDIGSIALPALLLAALSLLFKPLVFDRLLRREQEKARLAREIGVRLGQISEFSLLIAVIATQAAVISERASTLIQAATIFSFIASSYWIVMRYPTPIAVSDKLRRD